MADIINTAAEIEELQRNAALSARRLTHFLRTKHRFQYFNAFLLLSETQFAVI